MKTTVNRQQQHEAAENIVRIITEAPDSPVQKLITRRPPENDMEYLQLWFDYVRYAHLDTDHFHRLIHEGWLAYEQVEDVFSLRYDVWRTVAARIDQTFRELQEQVSFTPRLEQYVQTFAPKEQRSVRFLLIGYFSAVKEHRITSNLVSIGDKFPEIQPYIYALNEHHRLFTENVIELENSRFSDDTPLLHKDFVLNTALFKLFAGISVTEEELVMLKGSPVIALFGLTLPEDSQDSGEFQETESSLPGVSTAGVQPEDQETLTVPGPEDDSVEALIRFLRDRETQDEDAENDGLEESELEGYEEEIHDEEDPRNDGPEAESESDREGVLTPFADDLDYLHGAYAWLNSLVQAKKMGSRGYLDRDDQRAIRQLEEKAIRQKRISELRLQKSEELGFSPRLEQFSALLKLEEGEKRVLVLLLADRVFGLDESSISGMDVGDVLQILYENAMDRVKAKRYFMKQAKLVKANILQLENSSLSDDLMQCSIHMDNRLMEYFIGEDYDISNYVEGSVLTTSTIPLEHVILPEEGKQSLLTMIDHFPTFLDVKKQFELSSTVQYGDALVLLFVGPSGTGKTMLAHALGNYLDKRILLINVNNRADFSYARYQDDARLPVLFREARMHDALLFFDEAEELLHERMNDLLTEVEKHRGIVVFATNASFTIDEALRRRINYIYRFQEPGPTLRRRIWELHLPASVQLAEDVDMSLLARRFEINGGLIKNAVFSALARAAGEFGDHPKLHMRHLNDGAREQLKNKFFLSHREEQFRPAMGLDSVVLPEKTMQALEELVDFEKARKVLTAEWGFDEVFPDHNGVAVLFHGPSGTGKTRTAEAVACETGKKLRVVNYAQIISMWVGGTEKALEALFSEADDEETILLFDEADALFSRRVGVSSANDRFVNSETDVLLRLIERFNSMAVLTTNMPEHIDPAFLRRMRYVIAFDRPDVYLRERLWKQLVPRKLPLSSDIIFQRLAEQYDFNGGDIKNALFRAASRMALRLETGVQLSMSDIEEACREVDGSREKRERPIGFTAQQTGYRREN